MAASFELPGDALLPCRLELRLHPLQVATGAERLTGAGQYHDAVGRVGIDASDGLAHFLDQRIVHGVMLVRPVQGQGDDAARVGLYGNCLEIHGLSSSGSWRYSATMTGTNAAQALRRRIRSGEHSGNTSAPHRGTCSAT